MCNILHFVMMNPVKRPAHIIDINIRRGLGISFSRSWLKNIVRTVLAIEKTSTPVAVDLLITDDRQIHVMNRKYRGIDSPTDVLSFALTEKAPDTADIDFPPEQDGIRNLGEIIISFPRVLAQAAAHGVTVEDETTLMIVHGMLHLLGYDHNRDSDARRMRRREKAIISSLKQAEQPDA